MSHPDLSLNILIVDDQQRMRWTIKEMLRRMGYQNFLEADDGDSAQDKLKTEVVDLVLCDWRMPRMNGTEVLRYMREEDELRGLPFIMITAEMSEEVVAEAGELEVDAYLLKPFNMTQLDEKIKEVILRRGNINAIDTHLELGLTYVKANQLDKALAEYQEALKLNAKSPRTLLAIGQVFERQGNDARAKDCYHQAIAISPKFIKGHDALAKLYQKTGQADEAIKCLQQAASISPKNVERHFQLGQALMHRGRTSEAQKVFGTVIKTAKGQYSDVARRVGEAMMTAGLALQAEEAFKQALEANPKDIHLHNRLGIAYRKQGKFQEAVANYLQAISIAPRNEGLLYNLSRAYLEMGNAEKAQQVLAKALEINPSFQEARELMATLVS